MIFKKSTAKVYIDSSCDILYSSFYIYGLKKLFPKSVYFSNKYFEELPYSNQYLAFVFIEGNQRKNVIIDFADTSLICDRALKWCDVYGKINLKEEDVNLNSKIIVIGPSFGIKLYSYFPTLFFSIRNLFSSFKKIQNKKHFLSNYKSQFLRETISKYYDSNRGEYYVFFMSSLWKKESKTNLNRANFILSCLGNNKLNFEGGFAPRKNNDFKGFESLTTSKRIETKEYLIKISKSFLVFNTPAVLDCHGWKLGEYIAMNKLIISTPLTRVMPGEFKNRQHYFEVNGTKEEIDFSLNYLLAMSDDERLVIQNNLKEYYNQYLEPKAVLKKLLY